VNRARAPSPTLDTLPTTAMRGATPMINVQTSFGAKGDDTDDTDAFIALCAFVNAMPFTDGRHPDAVRCYVPAGHYNISSSLEFRRRIILEGDGGFYGSVLNFRRDVALPAGVAFPGIVLAREYDPTTHTTVADTRGSVIRDLHITAESGEDRAVPEDDPQHVLVTDGDYPRYVNTSSSGIVMNCAATVINCSVDGFPDDGIHIVSHPDTHPESDIRNTNNWQVWGGELSSNHRHGVFVCGTDSLVGCMIGTLLQANGHWGCFDRSPGCNYIACTAEENGGGDRRAYSTVGANNFSVQVGCYADVNSRSELSSPSLVVGGIRPDTIERINPSPPMGVLVSQFGSRDSELGSLWVHGTTATNVYTGLTSLGPDPATLSIDRSYSISLASSQSAPLTLELPAVNNDPSMIGRTYTVKFIPGAFSEPPEGTIILTPSTADPGMTIESKSSITLNLFEAVTVISDGAHWYVINAVAS
jgi:hypothetical protein